MSHKIEYPTSDGRGCSMDCGVAFIHTHPTGKRGYPVPFEDTEIMTETMEEKLNKVLWDNLCIDVIEMDSISYETLRPMKAKLQPELESFIKKEISKAISSYKENREQLDGEFQEECKKLLEIGKRLGEFISYLSFEQKRELEGIREQLRRLKRF